MSIYQVYCPKDKEHSTNLDDRFCITCGERLKAIWHECSACGKVIDTPIRGNPQFCPRCRGTVIVKHAEEAVYSEWFDKNWRKAR